MKRFGLIVSLLLNVLFICLLWYICVEKTDVWSKVKSRVMREVYVPARQDDNCVQSWNSCIRKLNLDADVVFFGNSITESGDFQEYFPDKKVVIMGYIGEDTKGMLRRVEAIQSVRPEKVFLMAGVNGLKGQDMAYFEKWYEVLVDSIRSAVPTATLYVQSILPVCASSDFCPNEKIVKANQVIKRLCAERGLQYVDLHSVYAVGGTLPEEISHDGLHLRSEAYDKWINEINDLVE